MFGLLDRVGQKLPVPAISLPEEEGEVGGISYRIRGAGPSLLEIAGQILLEVVMARHRMPLAALLAQPHPELLARVDKRRTRPLASDERKLLPLLGEHTAEVLADWLGLDAAAVVPGSPWRVAEEETGCSQRWRQIGDLPIFEPPRPRE